MLAIMTGAVAIHTRMNQKINETDRRLDQIELRIAERYVPRVELSEALRRFEDHMIRIEGKLDQIVLTHGG